MTRALVSIITGGRPALEARPTRLLLDSLREAGFDAFEWVVRSDHAPAYEQDDVPLQVYPVDWADAYTRAHWRHPTAVWQPGGFHGAFAGREWAMRQAEADGYDVVLQLDDNIDVVGLLNANQPAYRSAMTPGQLTRALVNLCVSTNAYMLGAQLSSVVPKGLTSILRPGYPYSLFAERTGPGRMPYYGPFEDDIMHALEYALHGGHGRTAGVVDVIRYNKEHRVRTGGMRTAYGTSRGLEIANRYPANVRIGMGPRTSGSKDAQRGVRHFLNTKGFTAISVTDVRLFNDATDRLRQGVTDALAAKRTWDQAKITRRAGSAT